MNQNNNIFKNSGIRGIAPHKVSLWYRIKHAFVKNKKTFFTLQNIYFLGLALSFYLKKKKSGPCNILIAKDTRASGAWIESYLQANLLDAQHHIFNIDIAPTPFIAKSVAQYKPNSTKEAFFDLGIMITASHNPPEYNGLKFFTPHGYLTNKEEEEISELFYDIKSNLSKYMPSESEAWSALMSKNEIQSFQALEFYLHKLSKQFNLATIPPLKVVIDCANGATYKIAQKIFSNYGVNTILINNQPDGMNINQNSGCSNPSLLYKNITKHAADWGCAFDGDGDRVIIVDKTGKVYDGDDILVILSEHPMLKVETTFVGTIMTNQAIENYFIQKNKTFIRTDVGERNIIEALINHNAQLGAEACGHITVMNHAPCSDGIFATLLFFATYYTKNFQQPNYTKYIQKHDTLSIADKALSEKTITTLQKKYTTAIAPGRVIIRKSNTEPVVRVMTEHEDLTIATETLATIIDELQSFLEL